MNTFPQNSKQSTTLIEIISILLFLQITPEKVYAAFFFIPQIFIAILITICAIYFNRALFLLLSLLFLLSGYYKYLLVLSVSYNLTDQQLIIERGVFSGKSKANDG